MVKKNNNPKNVNITTPRVTVNSTNRAAADTTGTARNRRRRASRNARKQGVAVGGNSISTTGNRLMELQEMNSGRMTTDPSSDLTFIRSLQCDHCVMDSNTEGWYFKYMDPAGAVETARAIGEFSKIPDGLLTFSVDAEIRTVDTLPVPHIDEGTPPVAGTIPLDGRTWSLTIFSYPMFRTAYVAVANVYDFEISDVIAGELAYKLNNLTDYRATIDSNTWAPFAEEIENGWYYWIKPLPPTYNLPDPANGLTRTLTSWRMSFKSLTIEHNTPTLINQGFWVGGHYALDPSIVQEPTRGTEMIVSSVHARNIVQFNVNTSDPATMRIEVRIPNLPQVPLITGPAVLIQDSNNLHFATIGDITTGSGVPVTWIVQPNTFMYNPFEVEFAGPGDTVSMSASIIAGTGGNISLNFTSTRPLSVEFSVIIRASVGSTLVSQNAEGISEIYVDTNADLFEIRTSHVMDFPAFNPAQISANNPKMGQFLMEETDGSYVVHKKMRKPVFEVTPAGSYGPVQFNTPGYDARRNAGDGSGILDTFDSNFSTASVCIRGISHANVPVVKLYQGWEGVTNVNTPFGQFGHTGLPRNDSVMQLVDNLTVRTTGIYPANDNFLGLIAKFAAGALRSILTSQATPALLGNLAQGVINKGISYADDRLSRVGRQTRSRMR